MAFLWSAIAQPFAGTLVELPSEVAAVALGEAGHALAFGQVLADETAVASPVPASPFPFPP
jgi:hypothetical protein